MPGASKFLAISKKGLLVVYHRVRKANRFNSHCLGT